MSDVQNVRFEILGPIRLVVGQDEVAVAGRERVLLVTLLYYADVLVEMERLVDAIWGDRPPRDARNQVQSCVSRLRKRLAAAGVRERIIITEPAGYRIKADTDQLDLGRFRRLVAEARDASSEARHEDAIAGYRTALAMWRGPALAGIDNDLLRGAATTLDEEHLQAIEERIELELTLGATGELVAELTDLVIRYPYRERLHGALMLALYRAGRQAEALAVYQRVRQTLVEEVGTEPGLALRDMHRRILNDDPTLAAPAPSGVDIRARHCLPRTVDDFTGRPQAVGRLVDAAQAGLGATTVVAIDGMAGIGKTTLAVHVAHLLVDHYRDAQLFVDLHGHSDQDPLKPIVALGMLLRQLGVPGGRIPIDLDGRVALWRHELAERRVLVVLDNAANSAQVVPLLPAGSGCLVLVTSRRRLAGLSAARPLSLDVLSTDEGVVLLEQIVGGRVRDEPAAATEVVSRCGHLPLAIRLAGARLAHRPRWRVQDLADRLVEAPRVLAELTAENHSVADAFALSYNQLVPDLQRVFRLLGLHPGEDFDACVVAALVDTDTDASQRVLDELVDSHLIDELRPGRYRFHDLVREYANRLVSPDPEPVRRVAVENLLDFYLHAAAATSRPHELPLHRRSFHPGDPRRSDLLVGPVRRGTAWLEDERMNLVAVTRYAASSGFEPYAWRIARAAWRFHYMRGYLDDLIATHQCGLAAAEHLKDDHAVATMCNYLASAYWRAGELEEAADLLLRAWTLRQAQGDRCGAVTTQMNLGVVYREQGRHRDAVHLLETAVAMEQQMGDVAGMGMCLLNLATAYTRIGRYEDAARCLRRSLAIARELGVTVDRAIALADLGAVRSRVGDYGKALRLLNASLALRRRTSAKDYESESLNNLGVVRRQLGDHREAAELHREAFSAALASGDRMQAYAACNELGQTLRESGDTAGALQQHRMVLSETTKRKLKYEQARALDGIAACLQHTDPAEARRHWQRALALYREMGVPEQAEVVQRLSELGGVAGITCLGMSDKSGRKIPRQPTR